MLTINFKSFADAFVPVTLLVWTAAIAGTPLVPPPGAKSVAGALPLNFYTLTPLNRSSSMGYTPPAVTTPGTTNYPANGTNAQMQNAAPSQGPSGHNNFRSVGGAAGTVKQQQGSPGFQPPVSLNYQYSSAASLASAPPAAEINRRAAMAATNISQGQAQAQAQAQANADMSAKIRQNDVQNLAQSAAMVQRDLAYASRVTAASSQAQQNHAQAMRMVAQFAKSGVPQPAPNAPASPSPTAPAASTSAPKNKTSTQPSAVQP